MEKKYISFFNDYCTPPAIEEVSLIEVNSVFELENEDYQEGGNGSFYFNTEKHKDLNLEDLEDVEFGNFECHKCDAKEKTMRQFQLHFQKHHLTCEICDISFENDITLNINKKSSHFHTQFLECGFCFNLL